MAYIGKSIESGTFSVLDTSGNTYNGSNVTFSLGTQVGSPAQLLVSHDGVIQKPGTDYSLATGGTQITFSTAPASGASIFIVEISGAVGGPLDSDLNGTELVLDADGDTSITADTDDQIDFKAGGTDVMSMTATGLTINDGTTITTADNTDTLTLTSTDADANAGPNLRLYRNSSSPADSDVLGQIDFEGRNDNSQDIVSARIQSLTQDVTDGTEDGKITINTIIAGTDRVRINCHSGGITFNNAAETMRIDSSGNVFIAKTGQSATTVGIQLEADGQGIFTAGSTEPIYINRQTDDGNLVSLRQADSQEGTITVSGSTVAYNTFCGTHWSRLADNSKPTILRGTVIESISTMMTWYQAVADVAESTDSEGNVIPAHQVKESINLPNGKSAGDAVTFTSKGKEYTGKYVKEDNEQLSMCKISNTEESKGVYGVFMTWDDHDDGLDGDVNDMHVASLGAFVVRIHKDETVAIGDYLQSKGDGTAKKQADDILRASTIAKVTSTEKTHEYADGSYCVPCTLHCG